MNQAQLNLKDDIREKDLELKLKESTSLSEDQIKEIVPVILTTLKEVHSLEEQRAENATKIDLENLHQDININNKSDVKVSLKNNEWTVIWAMNVNNITHNISITINQWGGKPTAQKPPESKPTAQRSPENKPTAQKPPESKPTAQKPPESKPTAQRPPERKPTEQRSVEAINPLTQNNASIDNTLDIYTLPWFLSMADELLQGIKETKDWISKKWLSKAWKKTMDNVKNKLKQYEKQLKTKKELLQKQSRAEIYDNDVAYLKDLRQKLNQARREIWLWQWGEFAPTSTSGFLYNSPENAKAANKRQNDSLEFNQKLQAEVKKWAILNIFNWNVQETTNFYRRIAQWEYTQADYELFRTNSAVFTPSFQACGIALPSEAGYITVPVESRCVQGNWWKVEYTSNTPRWSVDYSNMTLWEAFEKWWVSWLLGKALSSCKNMSPWQQNTWRNLWVLWCYAAWIFWLYKFFTSKKLKWREKGWLTAWAILLSEMFTWESPLTLFNKLMTWWMSWDELSSRFWNAFWDAVDWVWNSWIEASQTIVPSMYSMMIFNSSTTVWDVRMMTSQFKSDPNSWKAFRWEAITKLRNKYGDRCTERFTATFSDEFDEQKWTEWLASFWITDSTQNSKLLYELANNATMNEVIIEKFKSDNWLKETDNKTKKEEYKQYISWLKNSNTAIDVAVLQQHKDDWFEINWEATYTERDVDIQFKESLVNQVNSLSIDSQKKSELSAAIQRFYDERTIDAKPKLSDFSLKMENWHIILNSREWQEAEIDIDKGELVWFWNWIRFSQLSDLLNVADMSNKILNSQKGKVPKDMPPFQYKIERKWICFNDASSVRTDIVTRNNTWMDTRVLSTGWRWATSKVEALYNHPNEFAAYLSDRWLKTKEVDLSPYPLVKQLKDVGWLSFTDVNEVKNVEQLLNNIKVQIWPIFSDQAKPFDIWYTISNPTKRYTLTFTRLQWKTITIETDDFENKYPTIIRNKEKFLNFLNNPANWMFKKQT